MLANNSAVKGQPINYRYSVIWVELFSGLKYVTEGIFCVWEIRLAKDDHAYGLKIDHKTKQANVQIMGSEKNSAAAITHNQHTRIAFL